MNSHLGNTHGGVSWCHSQRAEKPSTLLGSSHSLWCRRWQTLKRRSCICSPSFLVLVNSVCKGEQRLSCRPVWAFGPLRSNLLGLAGCEETSIHLAQANTLSGQAPGRSEAECAPGQEAFERLRGGEPWPCSLLCWWQSLESHSLPPQDE